MKHRSTFGMVVHKIAVAAVGFVLGLVLLVIFAAAHAKADPFSINDAAYVSTLDSDKVDLGSHTGDIAWEIQLGHAACSDLQDGDTEMFVIYELHKNGVSFSDAGTVVGAAEAAYCPAMHHTPAAAA